jgi:hypothetical protein
MRDKKEDEFDHGTITMKLLIQLLYAKKKKGERNHCLYQCFEGFPPVSHSNFIVSEFRFGSLIYFELIF